MTTLTSSKYTLIQSFFFQDVSSLIAIGTSHGLVLVFGEKLLDYFDFKKDELHYMRLSII